MSRRPFLRCVEGLYFYLGSIVNFSQDPEVRSVGRAPVARMPAVVGLHRPEWDRCHCFGNRSATAAAAGQVHFKYIEASCKTGQLKEVPPPASASPHPVTLRKPAVQYLQYTSLT